MSPLNFSLFSKKTTSHADSQPFCGFSIQETTPENKYESLIHCLIKGMFMFAASFGCISGVLSEFDIQYNYLLVLSVLLISSMAISLIHLNKWLFNLGYPFIFVVFTTMLIRCRHYANSGFQALVNIINEAYSSHFLLLFTRESTETVTNRYLTITTAAIFLGVFLAILINVGIFNDMYFCTTFTLTFYPLQLGIYIGKYPAFLSIALIFFSYFGIYFLKHSNHYHYIQPGKKKTPIKTYIYKGKQVVHYKSNAKFMSHICAFALVLSLFFSSFAIAAAITSEDKTNTNSPMKEFVDPYVKIFVQNGISGFFNRYHATGGLSNGKLGGISSVRPDYQTDLVVTFVPYAYESLYLRAFIGSEYTGDKWNRPGEETLSRYQYPIIRDYTFYHDACAYTESSTLLSMMEQEEIPYMSATMMIENVDAASTYLYLPYYTLPLADHTSVTKENTILGLMPSTGNALALNYVPYSQSQADLASRSVSEYAKYRTSEYNAAFMTYSDECYDNYLQIPTDIAPRLIELQEQIGTSDNLESQIFMIRNYFTLNYTYDMSPGSTPRNADFVLYFLDEQKRGYCSHFASAATLIFRSYGIPARYVEGYVASQLNISERAQATDYKYDDFFEGENALGTTNVVEVDITDGEAHAWVEIFVDGFGWVPVEVTPPSDEEEEPTYGDFLAALTGFLAEDSNIPTDTQDVEGPQYEALFQGLNIKSSPVVLVFLCILAVILCLPLWIATIRSFKAYTVRQRHYHKGVYDTTIAYEYSKLAKRLQKRYPKTASSLPEDIAQLLILHLPAYQCSKWNNYSIDELIALTQKSCFSGKQISKETADLLIRFYRYARKH